jgi:PAS domain S-box-containing protein
MLRILYVDDEPTLLELAKLFLEQSMDFSVDTDPAAHHALEKIAALPYDAVVSDYQMPGMDGIAFLKAVRSRYGDIPFILFTGRGREEIVIEAINNGADFYLQKGGDPTAQFAELAHKIRQAVARRQMEHSLVESEKRLSDIINFLPDATFAIDHAGTVIAWNRAIEEMTGVPPAGMLGKGDFEYAIPFYGSRRKILIDLIFEPDDVVSAHYAHIMRKKDILIADTTQPRPKGHPVTLMGMASPLYDRQGNVVGAIESIRDITLLKTREEELRVANDRLTAVGEKLRSQYEELAKNEQRIRESEARLRYMLGFYEMAKRPEKELLSYAVEGAGAVTGSPLGYLAFLNSDETELAMYAWSRSAMQECTMREKPIIYPVEKTGLWGEAVRQRLPVITNDYQAPNPKKKGYPEGHPHIIRHMNVPVMDGDRIVIVAGVANKLSDYTDNDTSALLLLMQGLWQVLKGRQADEELLAANEQLTASQEELRGQYEELVSGEQLIRESESRFRQLADLLPQIVFEMDLDLRVTYANQHAMKSMGLTPEDLKRGVSALSFISTAQHQRARLALENLARGGPDNEHEYTAVRRDGTEFSALVYTAAMHRAGALAGFRGVVVDITDRMKTEIALRESEEKYRTLVEVNHDIIYSLSVDGTVRYVSTQVLSQLGYRPDEMVGRDFTEFIHKDDAANLVDHIREHFVAGKPLQSDRFRVQRKDGTYRWYEDKTIYTTDSRNRHIVVGTIRDITDQKAAEDALVERENTLSSIFRAVPAGIGLVINRVIRNVNDRLCEMTGYTAEELLGKDSRILYPSDKDYEYMGREKYEQIRTYGTGTVETRWQRKDGTIRDILLSSTPVNPADLGKGVTFTALDITDRKRTTEELRLLKISVDRSLDEVFWLDFAGTIHYVNDAACRNTGYSREEFSTMTIFALDPDLTPEIWERSVTDLRERKSQFITSRHRRRDGTIMDVEIVAVYVSEEDREFSFAFVRDITGRRRAEEALKESENWFRTLVETSPEMIWEIDPVGNFRYISPQIRAILGYEPAELMGKPVATLIVPDARPSVMQEIARHVASKTGISCIEVPARHKEGRDLVIEIHSSPFNDSEGRLAGLRGVASDVTERRRAQAALAESTELYQKLIATVPDLVVRTDLAGTITYINGKGIELGGYSSAEEVLGTPVFRHFAPEDLPRALENTRLMFERPLGPMEYTFITSSGARLALEINGDVLRTPDGSPLGMVYVGRDVTQRKKAEDALRNTHRQLSLLSSITRHDILNNITVIRGFLGLATARSDTPVMTSFLERINEKTKLVQSQIEFTRIYQDLGSHEPQWQDIHTIFVKTPPPSGITVSDTCSGIEINADLMLEKVFFNLIENSVRHGGQLSEITLTAQEHGAQLVIRYQDDGAGIPAKEKDVIFTQGYGKNTGFGLFLVREILAITGIAIRETGTFGRGASFDIIVPEGKYRIAG